MRSGPENLGREGSYRGVIFSPYLGPTSRWAWVLSREVRAEPRIEGNRPGPGVVRVQQTPPLLLRLSQPWSSSDCHTNRLGALDPAASISVTTISVTTHRAQTVLISSPDPGLHYCPSDFYSNHMGQPCRAIHSSHIANQCPLWAVAHGVSQPGKVFYPFASAKKLSFL